MTSQTNSTRRRFLGIGLSALACTVSAPAFASRLVRPVLKNTAAQNTRFLSLHNLHTDERLRVTYWKDGQYDRAAWGQLNHILRDHYSGDEYVMDLRLIDLVHDLQAQLNDGGTVEIISGYRSPVTNLRLSEASGGVAKNSFHMKGMAMDIRLDGATLPRLHNTALAMNRGGVGYYPSSEFVHVDVGPVRRWG